MEFKHVYALALCHRRACCVDPMTLVVHFDMHMCAAGKADCDLVATWSRQALCSKGLGSHLT